MEEILDRRQTKGFEMLEVKPETAPAAQRVMQILSKDDQLLLKDVDPKLRNALEREIRYFGEQLILKRAEECAARSATPCHPWAFVGLVKKAHDGLERAAVALTGAGWGYASLQMVDQLKPTALFAVRNTEWLPATVSKLAQVKFSSKQAVIDCLKILLADAALDAHLKQPEE